MIPIILATKRHKGKPYKLLLRVTLCPFVVNFLAFCLHPGLSVQDRLASDQGTRI
jgi:hypothetical protein